MLIDDICSNPVMMRSLPYDAGDLQDAIVLKIDQVSDYIGQQDKARMARGEIHEGEAIEFGVKDLPNVAPIAPYIWCEWHVVESGMTYGVLLRVIVDLSSERVPRLSDDGPWDYLMDTMVQKGARWLLGAAFHRKHTCDISVSSMNALMAISGDGSLVLGPSFSKFKAPVFPAGEADLPIDDEDRISMGMPLHTALLALCFAHCKGVVLREEQQPRQARRYAERHGKPPLVTFKILDIEPVTRILRDKGSSDQVGIKRALHICRGHFAHYTEDAPLFGHLTGTFYIPMHIRGHADAGKVAKDYRVLAPSGRE